VTLGLAALSLILAPHYASAATVIPLTLEEMERTATDVFVGTVQSTKAGWDKEHRIIETRVRIRVEERVKGARGRTVTVVVPGGMVGDIGMRRPGAVVFNKGERVLLLAAPRRSGDLRPVGLFQGKLRIRRDAVQGIDLVEPPGPAWGAKGERIPSGTIPKGRVPALPLSEVLSRLRTAP
jgi:hypothetical protein